MYPPKFDYVRVNSLDEAIKLLEHDEDARVLAGGQSLIPMLRLRLIRPSKLIDINKVSGLDEIRVSGDSISIGALVRHRALELSSELRRLCPVIPETASQIADVQVRNMGTIGGSIAHADPAADWPATLIALGASARIRGPFGDRIVPVEDLIKGPYNADLRPGEVIVGFSIPVASGSKAAYAKLMRKPGDFAIVGVAVNVRLDGDSIVDARIALTGVEERPSRVRKAEEFLVGHRVSHDLINDAADRVVKYVNPISDTRASSDFRRRVLWTMFKRVFLRALSR